MSKASVGSNPTLTAQKNARMVELEVTPRLERGAAMRGGSSPSSGTYSFIKFDGIGNYARVAQW